MNWDRIEGNWKQLKGSAKQHWGRLINDQFIFIEGKRNRKAGEIQESYGLANEATGSLHVSRQKQQDDLTHHK
jgi:uncharacterized protein YjbJ (UPF0337 family)